MEDLGHKKQDGSTVIPRQCDEYDQTLGCKAEAYVSSV